MAKRDKPTGNRPTRTPEPTPEPLPEVARQTIISRHEKTLRAIFERPTRGDIPWRDIEVLIKALGGEVSSGRGSRRRVKLGARRAVFHEPHPERVTDKGAVVDVRGFLGERGGSTMTGHREYKGYIGLLRVDDETDIIRGKVINTRDTITFQGRSVEEAVTAFRESVDDYLEFCESLGEAPDRPFSGNLTVRLQPDVHRSLSVVAQTRGVSLNRLVSETLKQLACKAAQLPQPKKDVASNALPARMVVVPKATTKNTKPARLKRTIK